MAQSFRHIDPKTPLVLVVLMLGVAALVSGCPTYEDSYSGTYREVIDSSQRNSDAVQVDFFRFGDNASAIVRFYKRDPITDDPFGEQEYCVWTGTRPFDEENKKFRLYISRASSQLPRSQLFGTIKDDGEMEITLYEEGVWEPYDNIERLPMKMASEPPDTDCDLIDDFFVDVEFPPDSDGKSQTMPQVSGYDIQNPVFAVSWVGVQAAGGRETFAPVNRHVPAVMLYDQHVYEPGRHGLRHKLEPSIPPPPDIVRMQSGTTRWALGHFVVVDDSVDDRPEFDDDWQFSWSTDSEKMVATPLQRATREDYCPSGTNRFGRALLFVEHHLNNLSPEMRRRITGIERCERAGACSENFYVVDICAVDDHVAQIVLGPPSKGVPSVPMLVTDEYLDADAIPLPRLNPYRTW